MKHEIPIVILGGADKPEQMKDIEKLHHQYHKETIIGYKIAELELNGKCLAQNLAESLQASECFSEIYIAGPKKIYESKIDKNLCTIINTDSHIGENLKNSLDYIVKKYGSKVQYALIFGDILPDKGEIKKLMNELKPYQNADVIYELVESPLTLGNSDYKPGYTFLDNNTPKKYLPGHLALLRPENLRTEFASRLFNLLYAKRGKDIKEKLVYVLQNIPQFIIHAEAVLESIPYAVNGVYRFSQRRLSIMDFEHKAAHLFVKLPHRLKENKKHVHIHTTDILSFGMDIDTKEELEELKMKYQKTP